MDKVYIYTLSTSEEPNNIRYIGKANNIEKRLQRHLQSYYLNQSDHKSRWLKKILSEGKCPIIEVLDIVPKTEWEFWEQYWIQQFKVWNYKLTNLAQGGEGVNWYGKKHSVKSRQKMRLNSTLAKKVIQYDLNGNKINEFLSICEASEKTGIVRNWISICCQKKGYYTANKNTTFRYLGDKFDYIPYDHQITTSCKSICQYDLTGQLIKTYHSIKHAARENNLSPGNISSCLLNKNYSNTSGGYVWKYKDEPFIYPTRKKTITPQCKYPVIQFDKMGNTIAEFESISDAARKTGFNRSSIAECASSKGRIKTVKGYVFKYLNTIPAITINTSTNT